MSISTSTSSGQAAAFSIGPRKIQLLDYVINSGATSGTVTATALSSLDMVLIGESSVKRTAADIMSANVATMAFTVPAETPASLVVQDITYTAVANLGSSGNNITIAYTGGATQGNEVVTVTGSAISVQIEDGVSTATDVDAAIQASSAALALVSDAITGTGSNAQSVATATHLTSGITGGARGSMICIGR